MTIEERRVIETAVMELLNNPELMKGWPKSTGFDNTDMTPENMSDIACVGLFNHKRHLFGLTEQDGRVIRAYFHNTKKGVWMTDVQVLINHKKVEFKIIEFLTGLPPILQRRIVSSVCVFLNIDI